MLHLAILLIVVTLCNAFNDFRVLGKSYQSDKTSNHSYHNTYDLFMRHDRGRPVKLLEITHCDAGSTKSSIALWTTYFKNLDLWVSANNEECAALVQPFISNPVIILDQKRPSHVSKVLIHAGTDSKQFDFIVDDGSHAARHQLESFRILFKDALKPGGIYFIQDIQWLSAMHKKIETWTNEFLRVPGSQVDVPGDLMAITCQREMCALHKNSMDAGS